MARQRGRLRDHASISGQPFRRKIAKKFVVEQFRKPGRLCKRWQATCAHRNADGWWQSPAPADQVGRLRTPDNPSDIYGWAGRLLFELGKWGCRSR